MTEFITLHDYWMGRDSKFRSQWSALIQENGAHTVSCVNTLLSLAAASGVVLERLPSGSMVTSGWRPPEVNYATPGAANRSKHMTGQAVDIYDPEGELDEWCMNNLENLVSCGLWMEHPSATKGWCHVQTVPPKSGRTVFFP